MQHHAWAIQYWVHQECNTMHGLYSTESIKCNTMHGLYSTESIKIQHCISYTVLSPSESNTTHGLYSTESIKIQHHAWAINAVRVSHMVSWLHAWAIQYRVHQNATPCMGYTVLESIKMQHHAWAIQYWVHQIYATPCMGYTVLNPSIINATPCMGYTVPSPSKCNTMHGLYSTESIKMQHHAWAIQYMSPSTCNTMHGLYRTKCN